MIRAIRAEAIRLLATPHFPCFLLAGLGVSLLLTAGLILLGPEHTNPPMPGPDVPDGIQGMLGLLVLTAPIPVLMGSRTMTAEYAHRSMVTTVLFQPRRHVIVAAKLTVMFCAGLLYGLVVAAGATIGLVAGAATTGVVLALPVLTIITLTLRIGLVMAFYTLIGVGIGALIPRPQIALGVIIGWFYFAESLLSAIPGIQRVYPFLPGGAASAITGQNFVLDAIAATTGGAGVHLLPSIGGMALLVGYAALAAGISLLTTLRGDLN